MTQRKARWHSAETLTFYSAPDSADSSIFKSQQTVCSVGVPAIPLDDAQIALSQTGPIILKLEAEGAEPEILDGAKATIPKLHYVAVDWRHESGPKKHHTFIEVCDRLLPLWFRAVKAALRRIATLFKNTNLA